MVKKENIKYHNGAHDDRNKKSLALNLREESGKKIFSELVKSSDVVVENMRPGAVDKMGLGYEQLKEINPALVYAAISGFGRLKKFTGPYAQKPAFDIVAEAMSGVMNLVGFEDKPPSWTIYGASRALGIMENFILSNP